MIELTTPPEPGSGKHFNDFEKYAEILAKGFSNVLKDWLTYDELAEINELNATPAYANGSCATHEFCDPNQAMIDAYNNLFGGNPEANNNNHIQLMNRAWAIARENKFYTT